MKGNNDFIGKVQVTLFRGQRFHIDRSLAELCCNLSQSHCSGPRRYYLADVRFRLIPKPRVSVPELKRRLVLLAIVLSQPEQLVDRVHRLLHDVLHLGLRYVRIFGFSSASGALFAGVNIFDGAVAERQCDKALGFRCQLLGLTSSFSWASMSLRLEIIHGPAAGTGRVDCFTRSALDTRAFTRKTS